MTFPQALQVRTPPVPAYAAGGAGCWTTGGVSCGTGTVVGAAGAVSWTITKHLLQYLSPGLITFPHALQVRTLPGWTGAGTGWGAGGAGIGGATGVGAGGGDTIAAAGAGGGTGAAAAGGGCGGRGAGVSSAWDAPQFRQNFAWAATGLPHSGQNGIGDHSSGSGFFF